MTASPPRHSPEKGNPVVPLYKKPSPPLELALLDSRVRGNDCGEATILTSSVIPGLTGNPAITYSPAMKQGYVYILASKRNGTLYIGVTSDLVKRIYEHKHDLVDGFTKQYQVKQLVYFEVYDEIGTAIHRETQMKKWNRSWKLE